MAVRPNSLSLSAVKIELAREERLLASGSAFVWRADQNYFLISNLHNFAGWDFSREKALSATGVVPTHVHVHLKYKVRMAKGEAITSNTLAVELSDNTGSPVWRVHPHWKERVDVGALKLSDIHKVDLVVEGAHQVGELATIAVNDVDFVDFSASAGDDAFVLGFPKGLDAGKRLPIWKRASIASEPGIDVNNLPVVLIDTATREGMSGAPVVVTRRGFTVPNGKSFGDAILGQSDNFLGVYSGRIGDDLMGVQLGWVWKGHLVQEIVDSGVQGTAPWSQLD